MTFTSPSSVTVDFIEAIPGTTGERVATAISGVQWVPGRGYSVPVVRITTRVLVAIIDIPLAKS